MPAILLRLSVSNDENFSGQVKFGFGAGADPRHQRLFKQRFGFPAVEARTMTEAGGTDPRRGFFSGHCKDSKATRDVWRGGWLHTRDVVRQAPRIGIGGGIVKMPQCWPGG
jgi:hypothetical protein